MEFIAIFKHTLMITFFVFVMMLLTDFLDTVSGRKVTEIMQGSVWRQYTLASFLGSTPGCLGAFMNVSLYVHGIISFGAIVGGMIATSGDEAFVMLAQFPAVALALFGLLFILGILFAWVSDKAVMIMGITPCKACLEAQCEHCESWVTGYENVKDILRYTNIYNNFKPFSFTRFLLLMLIISFLSSVASGAIGPAFWNWKRITFIALSLCTFYITAVVPEHYLHSHIWDHIIKKHLLRIFLWTMGALLIVNQGLSFWNLDVLIRENLVWMLVFGALIGIIPESGPHLIFVMLYAEGLVPFSVLFTASFVQDGHGMLPLLSYSISDSILIKVFNIVFGLCAGGVLFIIGF